MVGRKAKIIESSSETETEGSEDQVFPTSSTETAIEEGISDSPSSDSVEPESTGFTVVDRSNETPFSTIEVIESPKRGRPAGTRTPRVPRATPNQVASVAPPLIVGLMNQAVVAWAGPECAMLQTEANFLTPSIARIISRLPSAAAQAVSVYTDPFVVIATLGLWGARIVRIKDEQAKQKYQIAPKEAARAYGESGTEYTITNPPPEGGSAVNPEPRQNGAADAILRTMNPT
jgi:hypothetical protein